MVFSLKSNTKPFIEFTNCNLSQRLVELTLLFSMMLKSMSFLLEPNRTSIWGKIFLYSHLSFTTAYSLKSEKIGPLILQNCEAANLTVFTTMCPEEQQTTDNLIVNDYFVIQIFDKFSLNGILRGGLSHLNEA